jgi:hypothetical protein
MRRARVWLSVMAGCLLLSIAFVLFIGLPDETERIMRRHGPLTRRYRQNDYVELYTTVSGTIPERTAIYRELLRAGWTGEGSRDHIDFNRPGLPEMHGLQMQEHAGRIYVIYDRFASPSELLVHQIKARFGIDDSGK